MADTRYCPDSDLGGIVECARAKVRQSSAACPVNTDFAANIVVEGRCAVVAKTNRTGAGCRPNCNLRSIGEGTSLVVQTSICCPVNVDFTSSVVVEGSHILNTVLAHSG